MAINIKFSLVLLVVVGIFMAMFSIPVAKADVYEVKETKISAYFHDYFSVQYTPNATDFAVVGFPGKYWNFTKFGTLCVFNDLVTEGPEPTSATVGRLQGIYVPTSFNGNYLSMFCSLVFTNEAYNGSTLQIQGTVDQFGGVMEYSVTSGTGKFRYTNGYFTMEPISFYEPTSYMLLRINVTLKHF
ncbi:Plant disease resistance response protein [Corchorus olitorius]|uniref:Dirigent protein n=1 Tax=Corchorus olitorius TaxID=93759 RepID=A0A1R3H804_9ROSI|nr:Plant disease resistance response protein [Corchorus olitorius]